MPDRMEYIKGLRELADFLEARPELPVNDWGTECNHWVNSWGHNDSPEEEKDYLRTRTAQLVKVMGKAEKTATAYSFKATRKFSGQVSYVVETQRDAVCVATKETVRELVRKPVDEQKDADLETQIQALQKQRANIPKVEVEEDVEKVNWSCEPLMKPRAAA